VLENTCVHVHVYVTQMSTLQMCLTTDYAVQVMSCAIYTTRKYHVKQRKFYQYKWRTCHWIGHGSFTYIRHLALSFGWQPIENHNYPSLDNACMRCFHPQSSTNTKMFHQSHSRISQLWSRWVTRLMTF